MTDRRVSRRATWGVSALACGALVLGGAGMGSAAAAPQVRTASVNIQNFLFMPQKLPVKIRTIVTWTNNDSTGHTVIFSGFGTRRALAPGATWSHKFTADGTYKYYCSLHPSMIGKVVVRG
jgi:plastocyanin